MAFIFVDTVYSKNDTNSEYALKVLRKLRYLNLLQLETQKVIKIEPSVVACQRYVCPNVISMTMNVIIQECKIENCFIKLYV